jgi:hypothetical protein
MPHIPPKSCENPARCSNSAAEGRPSGEYMGPIAISRERALPTCAPLIDQVGKKG